LVLFSTGADKSRLTYRSSLRLVEGASRKMHDKVIVNIDYPFESAFPDEHGHVRTLVLPTGEYFLVPETPFAAAVPVRPVFRFTVRSGAATYIGNFSLSDNRLSWSASKFLRDRDYFIQKNAAMKEGSIEPQTAEIVSDTSTFVVRGILWGVP
jgi:hypothetical protein